MKPKTGGAEPLPYKGNANYRKEIPKFLFGNSSEERANNVRPYQDRKRSFEESYGFFYDTPQQNDKPKFTILHFAFCISVHRTEKNPAPKQHLTVSGRSYFCFIG